MKLPNSGNLPPETPFLRTASQHLVEHEAGNIYTLEHEELLGSSGYSGSPGAVGEPGIPEIRVSPVSLVYQMESYRVSARVDESTSRDLKALHGISAEEMTISALDHEDTLQREKLLYRKYSEIAKDFNLLMLTPWQKRVSRFFLRLQFPHYLSEKEDLLKLLVKMRLKLAQLYHANLDTFAVLSPRMTSLVMQSPSFLPLPSTSNPPGMKESGAFQLIGSLYGKDLLIFRNLQVPFNDESFLMGIITQEEQSGTFFLSQSRELTRFVDPLNMATVLAIRSPLCILHTPSAKKFYFKGEVRYEKKPWWRKLLKL
jgi:hypothetical protein